MLLLTYLISHTYISLSYKIKYKFIYFPLDIKYNSKLRNITCKYINIIIFHLTYNML